MEFTIDGEVKVKVNMPEKPVIKIGDSEEFKNLKEHKSAKTLDHPDGSVSYEKLASEVKKLMFRNDIAVAAGFDEYNTFEHDGIYRVTDDINVNPSRGETGSGLLIVEATSDSDTSSLYAIHQSWIKSNGTVMSRKSSQITENVVTAWEEWSDVYEDELATKPGVLGKYGAVLFGDDVIESEDTALAIGDGEFVTIATDLSGNMAGWQIDGVAIGVSDENISVFDSLEYLYVTYQGNLLKLTRNNFIAEGQKAGEFWGDSCIGADLWIYWYNNADFNFMDSGLTQQNLEPIGYVDNVFEVKKDGAIKSPTIDELFKGTSTNTIICEASGESINIADSADMPFKGINLYGRTEQFTTSGKNLLGTSSAYNIAGSGGVTVKADVGASVFYVTGTATTNHSHTINIEDIPAGTHTVSLLNMTGSEDYVYLYNRNTSSVLVNGLKTGKSATFTLDETTSIQVCLVFWATSNITYNNRPIYIQIEKGAAATSYEPYTGRMPSPSPSYPQEMNNAVSGNSLNINVTEKNVLDVQRWFPDYINESNGISYTNNEMWKIQPLRVMEGELKANTQYTFSCECEIANCEGNNITLQLCDNNSVVLASNSSGVTYGNKTTKLSVTNPEGTTVSFVRISYSSSAKKCDVTLKNIQLEVGDKSTEFEPYKVQSLTITAPNGLPGVPVMTGGNYTDGSGQQWVCDEIDLERGVYIQRVGEVVFDANWIALGEPTEEEILKGDISASTADGCIIGVTPSKLPFAIRDGGGLWQYGVYADGGADAIPSIAKPFVLSVGTMSGDDIDYESGNWLFAFIARVDEYGASLFDYTVEDIRNIVNGSKMLLIREDAVEAPLSEEELAAYKKLQTNKPVTNIFNDSGAHMSVRYIADPKKYIDNKFAAMEAAIISLGGNV